jgi:carbon storage regulator
MLVLSRQYNERIFIGDNIVLTVTRIGFDRVWLGIEAPRNIPVHREEVAIRIQAEIDECDSPKGTK